MCGDAVDSANKPKISLFPLRPLVSGANNAVQSLPNSPRGSHRPPDHPAGGPKNKLQICGNRPKVPARISAYEGPFKPVLHKALEITRHAAPQIGTLALELV